MIDTRTVDLLNIIPGNFKKVAGTGGGEYHGACPFCGGDDRFVIQPNRDVPRWWCRKCDRKGDAIAFVQLYHEFGFIDSVRELGLDSQLKDKPQNRVSSQMRTGTQFPEPKKNIAPAPDSVPALDNPEWQDKAQKFVEWSWRNLHSGDYPLVNQYLEDRGIEHYHSDLWMLGYNPRDFNRTWGGVDVYLPTGITIPWLTADESVMKINTRRFEPDKKKYLQVKGGANWLFNSHRIKADSIVVLVEGEIDAISIAIGVHHHGVVPVATGSSTGARWLRWAGLLASAYRVLIAFDDDDAGESASRWWAQYLPHNARRLLPEMKDANEMLINRYPMKQWIEKGLS